MSARTLLRNSERSAFKTCRWRWALGYGGIWEVGTVQSREPAKALWFGDLIHQALAAYYKPGTKRGSLPAKTFIRLYDADDRVSAVMRNDEGEWESLRDLGRGMLEAYVEMYKARDEEWEIVSSEQTFRLPIRVPAFEIPLGADIGLGERSSSSLILPGFRLVIVGTFDGLWRNRVNEKRLAFKEFKTAAQIATDGLAMDDQASYYWTYGPKWMWRQGILPERTYPSEILYTFLRKAIRNPDFDWDSDGRRRNKDGSLSKSQPAAFFERLPIYRDEADRRSLHERVLAEAREMELTRRGVLSVYKNPGPLHSPNCRGCPVREPCELHETGSDWLSMLNATTVPWDPYAAHELAERR